MCMSVLMTLDMSRSFGVIQCVFSQKWAGTRKWLIVEKKNLRKFGPRSMHITAYGMVPILNIVHVTTFLKKGLLAADRIEQIGHQFSHLACT